MQLGERLARTPPWDLSCAFGELRSGGADILVQVGNHGLQACPCLGGLTCSEVPATRGANALPTVSVVHVLIWFTGNPRPSGQNDNPPSRGVLGPLCRRGRCLMDLVLGGR